MEKLKKNFPLFILPLLIISALWLAFTVASPSLPNEQSPLVFYSNQRHDDLKLLYIKALQNAKQEINLQMYALTDQEILALLVQKTQEGTKLSLHYDASASLPKVKKMKHLGNVTSYSGKGLMHRKILTIDGAQVFLGSANLTTSSLTMHDNLVVGLHSPSLAHFLNAPTAPHYIFPITLEQKGELWLLPEGGEEGLIRLLGLIQQAKKSIYLSLFTFTHPLLRQALITAQKRGVKIRCAIDYYSGLGASAKNIAFLHEAGVPIYLGRGPQLLHHKWALIDGSALIVGSANWTKAAFEKNRDCFLILHPIDQKQKAFLKKMWKIIELESEIMHN